MADRSGGHQPSCCAVSAAHGLRSILLIHKSFHSISPASTTISLQDLLSFLNRSWVAFGGNKQSTTSHITHHERPDPAEADLHYSLNPRAPPTFPQLVTNTSPVAIDGKIPSNEPPTSSFDASVDNRTYPHIYKSIPGRTGRHGSRPRIRQRRRSAASEFNP